ncbi:hypothetical protein [Viscerimonas tarda]
MATKTAYITVRLEIHNPEVDEITDEDVEEVINEMDYNFEVEGEFQITDTEICGINE